MLFSGVMAVLAAALWWPPAQALFRFGSLHWDDLAIGAAASVLSLPLLEAVKSRWFRAGAPAAVKGALAGEPLPEPLLPTMQTDNGSHF